MDFYMRLKNYRKEAQMTQEDLARELDVTRQTVSKWERGQAYPEMERLLKMAQLFAVPLSELVGGLQDPSKEQDQSVDQLLSQVDNALESSHEGKKYARFFWGGGMVILLLILLNISQGLQDRLTTLPYLGNLIKFFIWT